MTECDKALGFWTVGVQYLHMVKAVSKETALQGNKHCVVSDTPISPKRYMEETKWSDHNLVIPLLFNFYHGLEVIMKGFVFAKGSGIKPSHKLTGLLVEFEKCYGRNNLYKLLEKYIENGSMPSVISDFLDQSNMTIDLYYQSLKYAESTKGNPFHHHPLKYKGEAGAVFFADLRDDIDCLVKEAVRFGRSICPNA